MTQISLKSQIESIISDSASLVKGRNFEIVWTRKFITRMLWKDIRNTICKI